MESHIRGDEDMLALLEEMGGGGDASSSSPTTIGKNSSSADNTIKNSFTMPHTLKQALQMLDELAKHSPDYEFYVERYDAETGDYVRVTYS